MSTGGILGGFINELANQVDTHRSEQRKREDDEIARRRGYLEKIYNDMVQNGEGDPTHYAQALKDIYTLSEAQGAKRPRAKGRAGFGGASDMSQILTPFLDQILSGEIDMYGGGDAQAAPAGMTPPPGMAAPTPGLSAPQSGDVMRASLKPIDLGAGSTRVGGTAPSPKPFNGLDFSGIADSHGIPGPSVSLTPPPVQAAPALPPPPPALAAAPKPKPYLMLTPDAKKKKDLLAQADMNAQLAEAERERSIARLVTAGMTPEAARKRVLGIEDKFIQSNEKIVLTEDVVGRNGKLYRAGTTVEVWKNPETGELDYSPATADPAAKPIDQLSPDDQMFASSVVGRPVTKVSDMTLPEQARVVAKRQADKNANAAAGHAYTQNKDEINFAVTAGQRLNQNTQGASRVLSKIALANDVYRKYLKDRASRTSDRDRSTDQQAIINTFMTTVDPTSAVREGEFSRMAEMESLHRRMGDFVNKIKVGGPVSDDTIADAIATMNEMAKSYQEEKFQQMQLAEAQIDAGGGGRRDLAMTPADMEMLDLTRATRDLQGRPPRTVVVVRGKRYAVGSNGRVGIVPDVVK